MRGQHDHEEYYTKADVDALLDLKADIDHTHDTVPPEVYGVDLSTIGPANEPTETDGIQATVDNLRTVLSGASPGDTILLRAGTYPSAVTIPAGTAANPITVKPYNGEMVTITAQWSFSDYAIIAGVLIDVTNASWCIRLNSKTSDPINNVIIRYCDIRNGKVDAIRFSRNTRDCRIHHNYIDGGGTGHCYKTNSEGSAFAPTNIEIDHNHFTKKLEGGGEDLIQLEGFGTHNIHHNRFDENPSEDGMDIKAQKTGSGVADVHHNYFDGNTIKQGAVLVHGNDYDTPGTVVVRDNHIDNGLAAMGGNTRNVKQTGTLINNLLTGASSVVRIRASTGTVFSNNYMTGGLVDLGTSAPSDVPKALVVDENRFDNVELTEEPDVSYASAVNNELNSVTGDWSNIGEGIAIYPEERDA